ncbi:Terpene synthase, metal-binding domain-containing protein [Cynara cardunculus var. scolymus]|uniref:ent-kaurene synthase n=1 Tax=Cynara cardunculus var. scolymus TaxID=59895 RepID=A0A103Y1T2_CYNCS|nr:Terpene synthase, metal-binding domain-containing protein [Cynara cardunculus var. scolymus]
MASSLASIEALVVKLKEEMFSDHLHYSFVSRSAYDTAWLAMIPHPLEPTTPLFKSCLEWLLINQNRQGYWGESVNGDLPTIDALPATLVCMVVLQKWGLGVKNIEKGLEFMHVNMEEMLHHDRHFPLPRWFLIVFSATIELAESSGLELKFSDHMKSVISQICAKKQQILGMEELVDKCHHPPLIAYLETFSPTDYKVDQETITKHLSEDGSLFQSPSATAQAYISTGNQKCLNYLIQLVQKCPNGVPQTYPMDEELVELSMVDQVERLGLSEYFTEEIDCILKKVYRSYKGQESMHENMNFIPAKLYKDSLAFRLFRLHCYSISPRTFCWFLYDEEILDHLEKNCGQFTSLMYSVYRATDLMFIGENEADQARSFSKKMLQKISTIKKTVDDNVVIRPNLSKVIEEELSVPWIARLDHLDHRMWIEQNKEEPMWIGKASFYRLSCVHIQLLCRWSKMWGLAELGFGREKTTYCYFVVAASTCLPHDSIIRMLVAKSAILITVADDFFDMKGSLEELQMLIEAIHRWDGKGLSGPSKVIFNVLDDLVRDASKILFLQEQIDVTEDFRDLWRETFDSWLTETTWGKSRYVPSKDEYMEIGMISIATHLLVLTSSCFLNPSLPKNKIKPQKYDNITRSLMASARLVNDMQSYQKEQVEGKMNLVLLHFKENPDASMDDSIDQVKSLLDMKRKELLKHVFMDDNSDFPKQWKYLHLSCFKVFQMLYNSTNLFDKDTELQVDIERAIYITPENGFSKQLKSGTTCYPSREKKNLTINDGYERTPLQRYGEGRMNIRCQRVLKHTMRNFSLKVFKPPVFNLCFT